MIVDRGAFSEHAHMRGGRNEESPVAADALTKAYGSRQVLRGVTFDVRPAECFALLGPNGAGKTTLMHVIVGLAQADGGALSIFGLRHGEDGIRIKSIIGFVSQEESLDSELTAREILHVQGIYQGLGRKERRRRAEELLEIAGLTDRDGALPEELSGGMRRRLQIARALVACPRLLVLDEPSVGLDPRARQIVWDLLLRLRDEQTAVFLSTHHFDEANALGDRVAIMHAGHFAYIGPHAADSDERLDESGLSELYMDLTRPEAEHEAAEL
jgi:lipooligosaccharide transport system ATP-binding protein